MDSPNETAFRVIDWVIGGIGGLLLVLWGMLTGRIKKVEDSAERISFDHSKLEVKIASDYVPKRDLERLSEALFRKLDTIESLLHQKADK